MTTSTTSTYQELKKVVMDVVNDDTKPVGKVFHFLESKTKVQRVYILIGLLLFLALYLVAGYGAQFLANIIGFIYPAYASMAAIETPDARDDTKWLTYWVVFSLFATLEYPFEFILQYIPFYYLIKCVFFAWLFLPVMNGASVLYKTFVRPFFLDVSSDVDSSFAKSVLSGAANILKKE